MHAILTAIGLGILGIDPITALYMTGLGMKQESKINISLFFWAFALISITGGALVSVVFGTAVLDLIQHFWPADDHPFWGYLEFAVSIIILIWVIKKLLPSEKEKETRHKTVVGSGWKYFAAGAVFAITSFSDTTFYAVAILGGESGNFLQALLLFAVWFVVSQFMAVAVYLAVDFNMLDKLNTFVDRFKEKTKPAKYIGYAVLVLVAVCLLAGSGTYLITGSYLF